MNRSLTTLREELNQKNDIGINERVKVTIISAGSGVTSELEAVQCEIARLAAANSNPIIRQGFEKGMVVAMNEACAKEFSIRAI